MDMRISKTLTFLPLYFIISAFIIGCSEPPEIDLSVDYLLPELRRSEVHSLEFNSTEGSTKIVQKDGRWWVDAPVDYVADRDPVEVFLRRVSDAVITKKVSVDASDYPEIGLVEPDALSATIYYGDGKDVKLTFGQLSFPRDTSDAHIVGAGSIASQYVRVQDRAGGIDQVYLAPVSLVDLTSNPSFWTDKAFVTVPSFRRLTISYHEQAPVVYFRSHLYGPLFRYQDDDNADEVDPNLFSCLEMFLARGWCAKVGLIGAGQFEQREQTLPSSLTIEDFMGNVYTIEFGEVEQPSLKEKERAALQAGLLSTGVAPAIIPMTISVNSRDVELDYFERNLKTKNLEIVQRLRARVVYAKVETLSCLFQSLKTVQ